MKSAFALSALLAAVSAAPPARAAEAFTYAHHAVSSAGPAVQTMFDRGLTLFYAYNGSQGVHVFQAAVNAEPRFAMGDWGLALSYSRDINTDLTEDHFNRAHAAIEKAASLEAGLSDSERTYIEAMRRRYAGSWPDRDQDERSYRDAMSAAVARFPGDDDLAALYAEALLENAHQNLWKAGTSVPATRDTTTMVSVLERVLARNPAHIMANHLMIHIFESSTDHTPAVASAKRLDAMPFAPEDEHLVHMPAHTWIDVGNYARAVTSSKRAIGLFDQYLTQADADRAHRGYLDHNINVGWGAAMMLGSHATAQWFAGRLSARTGDDAPYATTALRFGDWKALDALKLHDAKDALHVVLAYAHLLRGNIAAAKAEVQPLLDPKENSPLFWALRGRLALAAGDRKAAEAHFAKAHALEAERFVDEELPNYPTDEIAGFGYYRSGSFNSAEGAFRATLKRYPNDPRALYGLSHALQKEGKAAEAQRVLSDFKKVWQGSDTSLSIEQL